MTTRAQILEELDRLDEKDLERVHHLIRQLTASKENGGGQTLMAKLRKIQIEAPEDFAANLDQYVSGEKRVD